MIITNIIVVTIIIMTTCNYSYKYYTFFLTFLNQCMAFAEWERRFSFFYRQTLALLPCN